MRSLTLPVLTQIVTKPLGKFFHVVLVPAEFFEHFFVDFASLQFVIQSFEHEVGGIFGEFDRTKNQGYQVL